MKRLYRSRKDKMIAGVSGGLGAYFALDPVFIRALFILGIFALLAINTKMIGLNILKNK